MAALSRRPAALAALALALALAADFARSIHARVAYARPVSEWDPGPGEPERISWPPGADVRPDAPLGERVFVRRCAVCHDLGGDGDGPASPSMQPRPRDFSAGEFKYKSTPAESPPSADDLARTIRNGLPGSAMPYFRDLLSAEELAAVVEHVRRLAGHADARPKPVAIPKRPRVDAASVERGRAVYAQACASCHGAELHGGGWYRERPGSRVRARDLTAPWTFRGGTAPEDLWLRLTTGMLPGPMPSYAESLTPAQRWDVVAYVLASARPAPGEPGSRLAGPGQDADLFRRGDYLVHAEMCGLCHTHIDRTGIYREAGFYLAGGMRVGAYPHGVFVSRNLTPDEKTGTGPLAAKEIARIIREGRRPDRVLNPWGMPWWMLHQLAPEDALAIATYLKGMQPVRNHTPPPLEYGYVETLVAKLLTPLPGAVPVRLTYADGNFGTAEGRAPRGELQRVLVLAEWALLAIALALWLASRWGERSRRPRRRWRSVLGTIALLVLAAASWAVLGLPTILPPEPLARAVTGGIPDPPRDAPPERAALLGRGRYLFAVTSCVFCHGTDGSGGTKVSWRPFGTLWTRNITPDRETGIGAWSDAEVARAIRSGISRGGRTLHWQGMTWDLFSNLDEEDVRALVAFLRALPAVRRVVPEPRPPAPDDCAVYTFFLRGDSLLQPGCR